MTNRIKLLLCACLALFSTLSFSAPYYTATGFPQQGVQITSAPFRSEFSSIQTSFSLLPAFSGNNSKVWRINSTGTGVEAAALNYTIAALTGALNGSNQTYTIPITPIGSVSIFINGLAADLGVEYTLSGTTLTHLGTPLGASEEIKYATIN